MATLVEVARQRTSLANDQVEHLQQLVAEWGFLADLSFSDLLLYVPTTDGRWVILAQVRPATGRTIYPADYVGEYARFSGEVLDQVLATGGLCEGDIEVDNEVEPARLLGVPVRFRGECIAVLGRESGSRQTRMFGELERTYQAMFERFAVMIAEGSFPNEGPLEDSSAAPRIGDGTILLDEDARVRYASPNAMSVFHRVGINSNAVGMRLAEMGFNDGCARRALETRRPVIEEFDQTPEVTLLARCLPIMAGGEVTGGLLLVRDVTELRKRDRCCCRRTRRSARSTTG
jgi:hypothetical protein